MNMFRYEWKMIRRSTWIWTCSLIAVIALYLSLFPAMAEDAEQFKELFASYPEPVRVALGMSLDSIASLLGFYSFIFGFIVLIAAIQAMNLGAHMLSRETREKTADFLLTKPVKRVHIVTAKLLAAVLALIVTNIIYAAAASLMSLYVKDASFAWQPFLMISATALFVQLVFLSLGMIVSALARKIKSVIAVSLGIVFGLYALGMLGSALGEKAVRYLTPFKFFDAAYIVLHSAYEASFIIWSAVIIAAAISGSYYVYAKKDIHAV